MIDTVQFIKSLPIKHVDQKLVDGIVVKIFFEINDVKYNLYVEEYGDRGYLPDFVTHVKNKERCSFCRRLADEYDYCKGLSEYREELFAHLKTFNSIRLNWLFLT